MGGKPSRGTPADQRLSDNRSSGTSDSRSTGSTTRDSGSTSGSTGNDRPYDTYMPWASR